ncbi:uncharacterized protein ACA1_275550 [Acanthamoeba castellanii str. Neff]|uniref:Uncharacterized protein n=1 Tax=Acanthamoeba castellanii (strain ATCC 30010 / Neff) TaxID=1257118 RepID=L8GTC6_ACACF|nr:uncharacterized protein ACA1_275550 [Acanthamoeba castellanii str. Neff]ELR15381.1 hypothetical protein ACA1_275550 [Acanthamoeba castellanii str. Neff]
MWLTVDHNAHTAHGVPLAILRPIIGATEGVTKILIGCRRGSTRLEDEIATKFKKKPKRQALYSGRLC